MAEIESEHGDKVVVASAAYGRVRVGVILRSKLLPLQARDHYGCDLTVEGAREVRAALDEAIEKAVTG